MDNGRPITKRSKRPTDRAPHMGQYVRVGERWGEDGLHIVIENQAFFMPVMRDDSATDAERKAHLHWTRDMLCIALDRLIEAEIKRRMADKDEDAASVTYPPEMLPVADGDAQVVVVDPDTGEKNVVYGTEQTTQ